MRTLQISWLAPDGSGVGRDGDVVVHVPGALPGDEVRADDVELHGRTVRATLDAIVTPSPSRRDPRCPHSAACGGCDLDALVPDARRDALLATTQRALRAQVPITWVPAPSPTGFRARIRLGLRDGIVGYSRPRSHDPVAIDVCPIARPALVAWVPRLRALPDLTGLSHVELRTDDTRVVACFTSDGPVPREVRDSLAELGDVALDGRRLHGDPVLHLRVADLTLRVSPRSFFQANPEVNALLVQRVVAAVQGAAPERVLDLFGGIGNLGLPISALGVPVVIVDRDGQATDDAAATAASHGLSASVLRCPAERFDPSREAFDVAVLDPPRAGCGDVLGRVLRNRPRRVVLVACDQRSGARDVRVAETAGYRVTEISCLDMFPDTHHVETLLVMDRQGVSRRGSRAALAEATDLAAQVSAAPDSELGKRLAEVRALLGPA